MSLSVNLILPEEKRSGSQINTKTATKIASIAGPALILVIILQQSFSYYVLRTNLQMHESRWQAAEPQQNVAIRQQGRLNHNTRIKAEMEAWRESAPYWDSVLFAILESTPPNIQVISIRMQSPAAPNQPTGGSPPIRRPTLLIEGRVSEPDAMKSILAFKDALQEHHLIEQAVSTAEIPNFDAASGQEGDRMRVFSIRVQFNDLPRENRLL